MLMDFQHLITKHQLDIRGVLHVGAHLAEEAPLYDQCEVGPVWWVEANPTVLGKIAATLQWYPHQQLIEALVYSEDNVELDFHVTNYDGMSSSIFEFGTHTSFSPDTVFVDHLRLPTRTIDSLAFEFQIRANLLNMDLQGAELHALRGAAGFLDTVDYVLTEVNKAEVYVGCAQIDEIDEHLAGFARVADHWVGDQGWGDALYVRRR